MEIEQDTWNRHQFVSVNKNGNVVGYIGYSISRGDDRVHSLSIINFTDDKILFGMDLKQAIQDIFVKYNFRKINWDVVIGNPIEKNYDKLCKKFGGRIVGVKKRHCKLIDNKYYDYKEYEMFRDDYLNSIQCDEQ